MFVKTIGKDTRYAFGIYTTLEVNIEMILEFKKNGEFRKKFDKTTSAY